MCWHMCHNTSSLSASEYMIESTQIQEGGIDCGHFAIAYATEFCFGNNPECYR